MRAFSPGCSEERRRLRLKPGDLYEGHPRPTSGTPCIAVPKGRSLVSTIEPSALAVASPLPALRVRARSGPDGCATISPMRVRRARAEEGGEIAEVWLRSRMASVPEIPPPVHTGDEVRAWFEEVVLPEREVWVADEDGAVVAVLVLEDEWVDQLYVEPAHTGRGIGSGLMAVAKRQRPTALRLWTFEANVRARRFYERHGFVATGSTDGDNEEGAPDVRYEWSPPAAAS